VKSVPFLPAAREELLAAASHYDAAAPGLGHDFIAAVERAVARIAAFPEHGSPHLRGARRIILRRFPFSVVYLFEADVVLVVAIAHHSRRPGYWRARV
jgi:plasmid stabilization system protein ParE